MHPPHTNKRPHYSKLSDIFTHDNVYQHLFNHYIVGRLTAIIIPALTIGSDAANPVSNEFFVDLLLTVRELFGVTCVAYLYAYTKT